MFRTAIITALLMLSSSLVFSQKAKNSSSDVEEIKEVIENESRYFWARDFKNWKKQWVHEPYTIWTAASTNGIRQYYGWDAWEKEVKQLFKDSPDPMPYEGDVKKYEFTVRNYGDGAWVSFLQDNKGTVTYETRLMEKEKGKWKIAAVQLFFNPNETSGLSEEGENND